MIGFENNIGLDFAVVGFDYVQREVVPFPDHITLTFSDKSLLNFNFNSAGAWNNRLNTMGSIGASFTQLQWQGNVLKLAGNLLTLTELNIALDLNLTGFEVSKLQSLTYLAITSGHIQNVYVPSLPALKILGFQYCGMETLNISSGCAAIELISITANPFYTGTIDVSAFHNLKNLNLFYNGLSAIVFPQPNIIDFLDIQSNDFEFLDLSGLNKLITFLANSNPLTDIVFDNILLREINMQGVLIQSLFLYQVPQLKILQVSNSQINEFYGYESFTAITNQTILNLSNNYLLIYVIQDLFQEIVNRGQYPQLIDVSGATNANVSSDAYIMGLIDTLRSNGTTINCNGYPA